MTTSIETLHAEIKWLRERYRETVRELIDYQSSCNRLYRENNTLRVQLNRPFEVEFNEKGVFINGQFHEDRSGLVERNKQLFEENEKLKKVIEKLSDVVVECHDEIVEHLNHGLKCYHCREVIESAGRVLTECEKEKK